MRLKDRMVAYIYVGINKDYPFRVDRAWSCGDKILTEADLSLTFNLIEVRTLHAATWPVHKDDAIRELNAIAERMRAEHGR